MASTLLHLAVAALLLGCIGFVYGQNRPAYVKPCKSDDPKLSQCFINAIYHLAPYMGKGIPEIRLPATEPFRLKELALALTTGPNGYKITLTDMDIFGITNFTISKLKLSKNGSPFETHMKFPKMNMEANYTSSGVLLIIPAGGQGIFFSSFENTVAKVKGNVSYNKRDGKDYMNVDSLDVDFTFSKVAMHVEKSHKNNPILRQATNLFLEENSNEVVELMKPQLAKQLSAAVIGITNTILKGTPIDLFYI